MLAYQEWREMYKAGELTPEQAQFFEPRAPEALYDLEEDPFELVNLAGRKAYHGVLEEMRGLLLKQVSGMPDLGFIPEPVLVRSAADNPAAYGQAQKMRIRQLAGIADLGLKSFREARGGIDRALSSSDPLKRYWAWIVCSRFGQAADSYIDEARSAALADPDILVRMRAAEFLGLSGLDDPRPFLVGCLKSASSIEEACLILNSITLLHEQGFRFDLKDEWVPEEWLYDPQSNIRRRFTYLREIRFR
jgi:HEAT repeat protein